MDVTIQKGSLALFLASLALRLEATLVVRGGRAAAAGLGATLALLALVNENALALAAVAALVLALVRARRAALAPYAAGFALVLLPVAARNAALGGSFLPTAANFGVNFYIGNGAGADGLYRPLVPGRGHPDYEQDDARRLAEREVGHALTPTQVSLHWLACGAHELAADPLRALRLTARKARLLVARAEIMDAEAIELHADHAPVLAVLWSGVNASFALLLPLAVLGLACAGERRVRLVAPALSALVLLASLLPFFVAARLRVPVVPFLAPCAAFGLAELVRRARAPAERSTLAGPLALSLATLGVTLLPTGVTGSPRAKALANLASELLRRDDPARALEMAEAAVAADPEDADALYNRGLAARKLGRSELAEQSLRRSAELEPAYAGDCLRILGQMRALAGDLDTGLALLIQAVERDPGNAAAQHDLGRVHELRGEGEQAAESYRRALALDPGDELSRSALERLRQDG
jgi:tetratricopeptide (TPR) repeat protein